MSSSQKALALPNSHRLPRQHAGPTATLPSATLVALLQPCEQCVSPHYCIWDQKRSLNLFLKQYSRPQSTPFRFTGVLKYGNPTGRIPSPLLRLRKHQTPLRDCKMSFRHALPPQIMHALHVIRILFRAEVQENDDTA